MKRLLICKDAEQKTLLESRALEETENIKYEIVENPPDIEQREGYIGQYGLDLDGNLVVEYAEIPKTETELLKERIAELEETIMILTAQ